LAPVGRVLSGKRALKRGKPQKQTNKKRKLDWKWLIKSLSEISLWTNDSKKMATNIKVGVG